MEEKVNYLSIYGDTNDHFTCGKYFVWQTISENAQTTDVKNYMEDSFKRPFRQQNAIARVNGFDFLKKQVGTMWGLQANCSKESNSFLLD